MGPDTENIPSIVIGNKVDSEEREVKFEEAELFGKEQNYAYFETSAKTGHNIDEAIRHLVKEVVNNNSNSKQNNENIKIGSSDKIENEEISKCGC